MVDIFSLSKIVVILIVAVNAIAIGVVIFDLATGSYKRYIELRADHFEQLYRIESRLKGDKK
jgi:hypothetical protein